MTLVPAVRRLGTAIIEYGFPLARYFAPAGFVSEHDVAIREPVHVRVFALLAVQFVLARKLISPNHLAAANEKHRAIRFARVPLAAVKEIMLRESSARQHRRRRRVFA